MGPAGPAGGGDPGGCAVPEYIDVGAGEYFACGLRTDGTIRCWGNNAYEQLSAPRGLFVSLSVGNQHACALDLDGVATCWGQAANRETDPPAGLRFSEIAAGSAVTCGIVDPGDTVQCWGSGLSGVTNEPAGEYRALSLATTTACAIRLSDGVTVCWGFSGPIVNVPAGISNTMVRPEPGSQHACGLRADGMAVCWGTANNSSTTPHAGPFVDLESDVDTTCGLRANGSGTCWGTYGGMVGDLSDFDLGYAFGCGIDSARHMRCWGSNGSEQATPPACMD
jgi:hypothetical protein